MNNKGNRRAHLDQLGTPINEIMAFGNATHTHTSVRKEAHSITLRKGSDQGREGRTAARSRLDNKISLVVMMASVNADLYPLSPS